VIWVFRDEGNGLLQRSGIDMPEVRKGSKSTMFRTTIVVWLVLLVLALNVVAFVTRIIEKCRLPYDSSKPSERTASVVSVHGFPEEIDTTQADVNRVDGLLHVQIPKKNHRSAT
jgi:hypothetical protein